LAPKNFTGYLRVTGYFFEKCHGLLEKCHGEKKHWAGGIKGLGNVENVRGSLLTEDGLKRQVKQEHWQTESAILTCSASCTQSPSKTKHTRESR